MGVVSKKTTLLSLMNIGKMKRPIFFLLVLSLSILASRKTLAQGTAPSDFTFLASTGGVDPWSSYVTLNVDSLGNGTYHKLSVGEGREVSTPVPFSLSREDLDMLWYILDVTSFFDLQPTFDNSPSNAREFAEIIASGNGKTHRVKVNNEYVVGISLFFQELQNFIPEGLGLIHNPYIPPFLKPEDPCVSKLTRGKRSEDFLTPISKTLIGADQVALYAMPSDLGDLDHAGTVVYTPITLQELIRNQQGNLKSKGGFSGDIVRLTARNDGEIPNSDVTILMHLDLYGPGASPESCQKVEDSIEKNWSRENVFFGDGAPTIDVNTDVIANCSSNLLFPPRTPGYHQIRLLDESNENFRSHVDRVPSNDGFRIPVINEDVTAGTWATKGENLEELYAHEAGHLLGLADDYDDWNKNLLGEWERERDGKVLSSEELAALKKDLSFDTRTVPEITESLSALTMRVVSLPQTKALRDDLMANSIDGIITDEDLANLARQAGLLVFSDAGQLLMPRDPDYQNIITTRNQRIFIPRGEVRTVNGIWGKCTEMGDDPPIADLQLDLGPSLETLDNYPLVTSTFAFVDSMATNNLYCSIGALNGLWRLTDNHFPDSTFVNDFLGSYGVEVGNEYLEFPPFTNPGPTDSISQVVVPPEVFAVNINSGPTILDSGQGIDLGWTLSAPTGFALPAVQDSWSVLTTSGESPVITQGTQSAQLSPQLPGLTTVKLNLELGQDDGGILTRTITQPYIIRGNDIETFEVDSLSQSGFTWIQDERNPWFITDWNAHTGGNSLRSGIVIVGDTGGFEPQDSSSLSLEMEFDEAGAIGLSFINHSALSIDSLIFEINGIKTDSWTAKYDWETVAYPVEAGTHTFRWTFLKGLLGGLGTGAVYLDNVMRLDYASPVGNEASGNQYPTDFALEQSYPNPSVDNATIHFTIPADLQVKLILFDTLGREQLQLVDGILKKGLHRVQVRTESLPSGVYFYRLEAGKFNLTRKLVVVQ